MINRMDQSERLRQYNRWRRGDDDLEQPNPKELGELIEGAADRLEVLERLASDVDRCYRMLLSEPDTKGALFKAENILREALAEIKMI